MTVYKIFEKFFIPLILAFIAFLPGSALAQGKGSPSSAQGLGMFLPLILIFVIFYLLIVRPQQKQAKKRQEMIKNLQKGDEVITVGGIIGRVVGVADNILTVEIADNCKVKMDRSGVQSLKGEQQAVQKK
jgi:preprotein translocase subunit YajC